MSKKLYKDAFSHICSSVNPDIMEEQIVMKTSKTFKFNKKALVGVCMSMMLLAAAPFAVNAATGGAFFNNIELWINGEKVDENSVSNYFDESGDVIVPEGTETMDIYSEKEPIGSDAGTQGPEFADTRIETVTDEDGSAEKVMLISGDENLDITQKLAEASGKAVTVELNGKTFTIKAGENKQFTIEDITAE